MPKYPTEWTGGIPRGGISRRQTYFNLGFSSIPGNKGSKNHSYRIADFKSEKDCLKHVERERIKLSHEYGLTRNEYRHIDANTIEVQLTQGKTFVTDAENTTIVNKYPLQAKKKKEKGTDRFYVVAQDKKKAFKFSDLLNNYKIVEYIDGNTMNLKKSNLKEFGIDMIVKTNQNTSSDTSCNPDDEPTDNLIDDKAVDYFKKPQDLPKNKWILGTIPGTVFSRTREKDNVVTMRIKDNVGVIKSKTFKVDDYKDYDDAFTKAKTYLINIAHAMGVVKNELKITNHTLNIWLGNDYIMKTDIEFLELFIPSRDTLQPLVTICQTCNDIKRMYAAIYFKENKNLETDIMYYHKFIMGSPMIDHINGDTLDNRLENLRYTYHAHNNTNRKNNSDGKINGINVKLIPSGKIFTASISNKGVRYSKEFPTSIHKSEAEGLAVKFRKNAMEIIPYCDLDDLSFGKSDIPTIKNTLERTTEFIKFTKSKIIKDPMDYLPELPKLSPDVRTKMWDFYFDKQSNHLEGLIYSEKILSNLLSDLKKIHKTQNIDYVEV